MLFITDSLDAAAGVCQPLVKVAAGDPWYWVLSGAFTSIRQAMAVPKGNASAAAYVEDFIARRKAEGFVHAALAASGHADVTLAP